MKSKIQIEYGTIMLLLWLPIVSLGKDTTQLEARQTIVLNKNINFSDQLLYENTNYEIRDYYDLRNEIVVLPPGCYLLFNGGALGNGTVDFTNCLNNQIYYSWFGDFATCNRSLLYLDNKELIIDKDIYTKESFIIPKNKFKHQNITIRGAVSTREERPRIVADDVPCFKVYGHFIRFLNIGFGVRSSNTEVACVELECPMDGLSDVDCDIRNCHFSHTGGGVGVKCIGRGITVEDCIFQTPVASLTNKKLHLAAISLYPDEEPLYPVPNGTQWHDKESGGRGIIVRNNRLHLSSPGCLVGLYANPECPEWAFHGVQIVGNLVDAEGSLCVITANNSGTIITGNTNYARTASTSMFISKARDMLISNNVLGQLPINQAQTTSLYDIVFESCNAISPELTKGGSGAHIESVIISGNILGSYKGSVLCAACDEFNGVLICNNFYGQHAFEGSDEIGCILEINNSSASNISVKNNRLTTSIYNKKLYSVIINDEGGTNLCKSFQISGNHSFNNYYLNGNAVLEDVYINKELVSSGSSDKRPSDSLEQTDVGYTFFDTDLGIPVFWDGYKWVDYRGKKR